MFSFERIKQHAFSCGFDHCALLDVSTIRLLKEVRDMCMQNTCREYGRTWCCPPGLGTLEECEERIRAWRYGILVQTVGKLEDSFDYDSMMLTLDHHKNAFARFRRELAGEYPDLLALGAGGCTICEKCTYPDTPCLHPEEACASMEGYGMLVTDVCQRNGLSYYYGTGTVSYTSCCLLEPGETDQSEVMT